MKKKDFIRKVLKDKDNTVFVTKEQVENAILIFEKLGMKPPPIERYEVTTLGGDKLGELEDCYEWE